MQLNIQLPSQSSQAELNWGMQVTVALMAAPAKPELAFPGALQIGKCTVLLQWDTVYSVGAQQTLCSDNWQHTFACCKLAQKERIGPSRPY